MTRSSSGAAEAGGVAAVAVGEAEVVAVAAVTAAELPEVEVVAAVSEAVSAEASEAEIDRPHCRREAGTSEVVDPADQAALEIGREASAAPEASADLVGSEIGRVASAGPAASADPDAPVASVAPEALVASADLDARVASAALAASEIGRASAIALAVETDFPTPAIDTTFGRTPTTTGTTDIGTAIGVLGASALWPGV
jgi:hypothetical protein